MKTRFKYNKFFLFYTDSETDIAYQRARVKLDLQTLKFVLSLGAILSVFFLFFDIYRFRDVEIAIIFRGLLALSLLALLLFIKFINTENYKTVQFYIAFIVCYAFLVAFCQAFFMAKIPIFLSNMLSTIIFVSSTIFGLRFRYIVAINTVAFIGYFIYVDVQAFTPLNIAFTQIPQLSTFYVVGVISAYVLELHKMSLFKNTTLLKEQIITVENLNQVKDRLFRTISHDIRGPIMNLKGVTELFKIKKIGNDELISLVASLDGEVAHTSNLIDNLLAWSKSQIEGLEIEKTVYNISSQIETTIEINESLIKAKNIQVILEIDSEEKIYADKEMMLIVIRNLLSNAIKFTPIGGSILIQGKNLSAKRCFRLIFKDTGAGIDEAKISQLFQVSHNQIIGTHLSEGAGLGLSLVKEFIDLNAGEITCESKVGVGTTFTIDIPQPEVD